MISTLLTDAMTLGEHSVPAHLSQNPDPESNRNLRVGEPLWPPMLAVSLYNSSYRFSVLNPLNSSSLVWVCLTPTNPQVAHALLRQHRSCRK